MEFWRFVQPSPEIGPPLEAHYIVPLVMLSFVPAILAGYTALEVVERVTSARHATERWAWRVAGCIVMGTGIWAMHFIGMLACMLPATMSYGLSITLLSVIPAILGSCAALHFMDRSTIDIWRLNLGGLFMALGIGGMHYLGMEGMRIDAYMFYDLRYFILSILVAHALATLALYMKFANQGFRQLGNLKALGARIGAGVVMGFAVTGMHYTAMMAATFYPAPTNNTPAMAFTPEWLAGTIAIATAMILGLAIVSTIVDRRMSLMAQSVLESNERARLIVETVAEGILGFNQSGSAIFANPSAKRLLDFNRDIVGHPTLHDAIHPRRADGSSCRESDCPLFATLRDGIPRESEEERLVRRDGTEFPIHFSTTALTVNGQRIGTVLTFTDISRARETKEALQRAKEAAEESVRSKSAFLANMSHEIRTPMNGILGMGGLLHETKLDHEQKDYTEAILRSAEALLAIINDILDYSKIEASKLDIETLDFNLRILVEDVIQLLAPRAEEQRNELMYNFSPAVPETVAGDPGRIRQILLNLASNALKFTEDGEVLIGVSCESKDEDSATILFEITDTGIGIPEDRIERIFESFTQADGSTTRRFGGTGLGLTISRELVSLMGGELGVDSEAGKGSRFWFKLSFERRPDLGVTALPDLASIRDKKVLIVDDNNTNRSILRGQVANAGMIPFDVSNGPAGLALLRERVGTDLAIDAVLVDFQMPDMDGHDFARAVTADPVIANTMLALLTSIGCRGETKAIEDLGFAGYLVKPVTQSQLIDCVLLMFAEHNAGKAKEVPHMVTRHTIMEMRAAGKYRVLVAEDNIINQKVALRILQKRGFRVDIVANGLEAIEAITSFHYDVILMDCQMPEMDGYEATRAIRGLAERSGVPIIAMTANVMEGDRERCIEAGMNDHVGKPIDPQVLFETIEEYIGGGG